MGGSRFNNLGGGAKKCDHPFREEFNHFCFQIRQDFFYLSECSSNPWRWDVTWESFGLPSIYVSKVEATHFGDPLCRFFHINGYFGHRPWVRYGSQAVQQLGCKLRCYFGQCAAGGLVLLLVSCCFFALLRVCSSRHVDLMNDFAVSVHQYLEIIACSYGRSACVRAVFHLYYASCARPVQSRLERMLDAE